MERACLGRWLIAPALLPAAGCSLTVLLMALAVVALALLLTAGRRRRRRTPPLTGAEGMVGELGEVVNPEGKVFVHGEYWNASIPPRLPRGAAIRVVKVMGERLEVEDARL